MRRIGLAVALALSLALAPLAAFAQSPPRIGLLSIGTDPVKPNPLWVAFLDRLGQLGYIEGQNIAIERRFAGGRQDRLRDLVADLAERRVDVVAATAEVEALTAKRLLRERRS